MNDKANIHWEAALKRRRILPFRGLAHDAAFIWRMCDLRYAGEMDSRDVQSVIEENLAASRAHRFPMPQDREQSE